ncbi:MAG: hypothetical protein KJ697_03990 [Nanoarchaeota archaeon]|nr:hypothetical protein [Nanoarchaeota archaeon]
MTSYKFSESLTKRIQKASKDLDMSEKKFVENAVLEAISWQEKRLEAKA